MGMTSETITVKKFTCDSCGKEISEKEADPYIRAHIGFIMPFGDPIVAVVKVMREDNWQDIKDNVLCNECKKKYLTAAINELEKR